MHAISIATPGGSSMAVATAGTVLASVVQPLCTLNWKCTATTYSDSKINADSGIQASVQPDMARRSASVTATAVAMTSNAYTRTNRRTSGDSESQRPTSRGGRNQEGPPGQA